MKFEIIWHPAAVQQLMELNWHVAENIDASIIRLAETGRGDFEWVAPHYRLRVGVYRVRFSINRETRTLSPLFIYRAR